MPNFYDQELQEIVARGGSFDLTGTTALTTQQFWGFSSSDGAVIDTIKGIPVKSTANTRALITAAEVDLKGFFLTGVSDPLFAGVPYRIDGYVITNIKLTSGSLHLYRKMQQITA
jgi:hypothetical protein